LLRIREFVLDENKATFSHNWASLVPELQRAGLKPANPAGDLSTTCAVLDRREVLVCGNIFIVKSILANDISF
jgi:hypothetical protein